jgi:hypothetical protein
MVSPENLLATCKHFEYRDTKSLLTLGASRPDVTLQDRTLLYDEERQQYSTCRVLMPGITSEQPSANYQDRGQMDKPDEG